jgi:hypothetical protein
LTTDRESAEVAKATVRFNRLKALQVLGDFATEITFALPTFANDEVYNLIQLFFAEFACAHLWAEAKNLTNLHGTERSDAINIAKGVFYLLVVRDIDAENAGHMCPCGW